MKWYENRENDHDVVISSRVRLARNLEDYPFTTKLDHASSEKVAAAVKEAFTAHFDGELTFTDMADVGVNKQVLMEDHLISPDFCAESDLVRALITDKSENLAVMVNEEDHVRIQAVFPGFALDKAWELANKADDALNAGVRVAFDDALGFLTACPTNLGTGLRASVMLHLPAMSAYGYVKNLQALMQKIGLTVRGIYGEGSEALACMYQLSNQVTLGVSESDAIEKLRGAAEQIIAKERELREQMASGDKPNVADKLWRSYGTLRYARKLDTAEAARLISNVRLGEVCGLIPEAKKVNLTSLLMDVMPAHIAARFPEATTPEKRDICRASYIRSVWETA